MNVIFPIIILLSTAVLCFSAPEIFITAMTDGATKAVTLSISLIAVYSVWLGIFNILESAAISPKIAKILKKPIRFIFGKTDDRTEELIAANVSANMLGIGGVATPLGINAAERMQKNGNYFAFTMLLVVASTSLQLLPSSVLSLLGSLKSEAPSAVILPSFLSTLVSSVSGVLLTKIFVKR